MNDILEYGCFVYFVFSILYVILLRNCYQNERSLSLTEKNCLRPCRWKRGKPGLKSALLFKSSMCCLHSVPPWNGITNAMIFFKRGCIARVNTQITLFPIQCPGRPASQRLPDSPYFLPLQCVSRSRCWGVPSGTIITNV